MFRLDKDLWRAVSPLLDQALDLEPQPRAALLAEIGQQRPDLAELLARLLNEHDRLLGSDFLESSLTIEDTPVPSLAGHAVGPYTLEAPLGMGAMGTVWRARRSDGRFEGCVAVKLLNLSLLDRRGDERFKREGTLLARLAHPHIARLLDAGVTPTGQPHLVLEFVDGTAIDRFADQRRLNPFRRLELFLQVADAVAHAHASLIVHRDLKPSNVLVRADGHTKLLDFGVGTLLEEESNRPSTLTIGGANALTPEYASPEQASGDIVTTATDVYALGVLLYTDLWSCLQEVGFPEGEFEPPSIKLTTSSPRERMARATCRAPRFENGTREDRRAEQPARTWDFSLDEIARTCSTGHTESYDKAVGD